MEAPNIQRNFRVCPNCGAPTPPELPDCVNCGHRSVEAVVAHHEMARTRRFINALVTRRNPFTYIFITANVAVFILMWLSGGMSATAADDRVLIAFGANNYELVANGGQYWRFVTSMFIHIGFIHLFLNNYALWIIGQEIERLYGSSRFVTLYLLTGIAGSAASFFYTQGTSAGASGAIFGLFGVLATFAFRYRKEIPAQIGSSIRKRIIPLILINLSFGLFIPVIDNAGHVGGLVAGILLGLIVPYQRPHEKATTIVWRALLAVCLAAIAYCAAMTIKNYDGPRPSFANLAVRPQPPNQKYVDQINNASAKLSESINTFANLLRARDERASSAKAIEAADEGMKIIDALPEASGQAGGIRNALEDLLQDQKDMLERYRLPGRIDWTHAADNQARIIRRYEELFKNQS